MGDCIICICSWCKKEFGIEPAACQISKYENCKLGTYLAKAMMFCQKRCERLEKQRDGLVKALKILEKIFADTDFIEEEEQEDFLHHVWTLAHGALYNLKRELALEREYLELARREAGRR